MWETSVWSLGQENPLEKGIATHSSILTWRSPWTEETLGLQSVGLQRVGHNWTTNTFTFTWTLLNWVLILNLSWGLSVLLKCFSYQPRLREYFLPSLSPWDAVINKSGKHVEMIKSTKLIRRINIRGSMQIPILMALRQLHKPPLPDHQEGQHMNLLWDIVSLLEPEKIFPSITYLIAKDDGTVWIPCVFDQLSLSQPNVSLILNHLCILLGFRIEGVEL